MARKRIQGFTLVELLTSAFIMVMVFAGASALYFQATLNSTDGVLYSAAVNLASQTDQQLEQVISSSMTASIDSTGSILTLTPPATDSNGNVTYPPSPSTNNIIVYVSNGTLYENEVVNNVSCTRTLATQVTPISGNTPYFTAPAGSVLRAVIVQMQIGYQNTSSPIDRTILMTNHQEPPI